MRQEARNRTMRLYRTPGSSLPRRANVIHFSPANSWEHERKKAEICYNLLKGGRQFITEAQRIDNNDIVDIVCLDTGTEYEVDHRHGNVDELRRKGREVKRA